MNTSDKDWLEKLFSKRPGEIKPGLERIKCSYEKLGKPLKDKKVVLVGGTNGKGSTGGMIAALLSNSGIKVGHYTSPHISCFSERIRVSGEDISLEKIKNRYDKLLAEIGDDNFSDLSFFEVTTLLAFLFFEELSVDVAVIEVGLGGRLDATNILSPDVSIITSIALDHVEWLGDSIKDISYEKSGIARKGKPLLLGKGVFSWEESKAYYDNFDHDQTMRFGDLFGLEEAGEGYAWYVNGVGDKNKLPYPEWLPNNSEVMKENFSLALKAADLIMEPIKSLADTDVDKVLRTAVNSELSFRPSSFSARGEWLNYLSHRLYMDVAHNPAALEKSLDFFISSVGPTYKKENHVAVLSLLADKDVSGILKVVFSKFSNVILFRADSVRGASIEDYKLALDSMSLTGVNLSILDDYDELEEKLFKKPSLGFSDIESLYFGGSFSAISQISKTIRSS